MVISWYRDGNQLDTLPNAHVTEIRVICANSRDLEVLTDEGENDDEDDDDEDDYDDDDDDDDSAAVFQRPGHRNELLKKSIYIGSKLRDHSIH